MRTTLTLEDDVSKQLRDEMRRSGRSLKAAVNHFLRIGLTSSKKTVRKPFRVRPKAMGLPPGLSYDNIGELLEALDGPLHK